MVILFFRSDVCSQSYEVMHASSLHAFGSCTRASWQKCENHCEYTLDRSDQLLFSCSPPKYARFKRYYARAHVYARNARVRARRKKMNKMKKLRLVDTFTEGGLSFFIFSLERLQNLKKMTAKSRKKGTKVACTFTRAVRARVH